MARKRPTAEFDATQSEAGSCTIMIDAPIGGYNGYVSPDLLSPKFWVQSSNIYAGQFGTIRRARWAPVLNSSTASYTPTASRMASLFSYFPAGSNPVVFLDNPQTTGWVYGGAVFTIFNLTGLPSFAGPFSRIALANFILQANGSIRTKIVFSSGIFFEEFWGLDAPDSSPQIALTAGSTATIVGVTGASRTSNVVTITATAALPAGFVTGTYVGISGVADASFNTATGAAVQITVT